MPLYEYECTGCHRRIEKIQKFSDADLTVCPHCGGRLERTITAAAISFKGGGWYKDGYSSVKPGGAGGGESSAGEAAASSSVSGSGEAGSGGSGPSDGGSSGESAKVVATPSAAPAAAPAAPAAKA